VNAVAAVVVGVEGGDPAQQRSPSVNNVARGEVRRDPVLKRPQIGSVAGYWQAVFYLGAGGLQLGDERLVLRLPLAGRVTKINVVTAHLQDDGGGLVGQDFRHNAESVRGGVVGTGISADGLGITALQHAHVAVRIRGGIVAVGDGSADDNE